MDVFILSRLCIRTHNTHMHTVPICTHYLYLDTHMCTHTHTHTKRWGAQVEMVSIVLIRGQWASWLLSRGDS